MVGTKFDLVMEEKVPLGDGSIVDDEEAKKWAKDNGAVAYITTSAKTGHQIEKLFLDLSKSAEKYAFE